MKLKFKPNEPTTLKYISDRWANGEEIDLETKLKYYELKEKRLTRDALHVMFNYMFAMCQEFRKAYFSKMKLRMKLAHKEANYYRSLIAE